MTYQDPKKVVSPKAHWQLSRVIYDDGPGGTAIAIGLWDHEFTLGVRWNGSDDDAGIGNPQSRGLPTWFILPGWCHRAILDAAEGRADVDGKQLVVARNLLSL